MKKGSSFLVAESANNRMEIIYKERKESEGKFKAQAIERIMDLLALHPLANELKEIAVDHGDSRLSTREHTDYISIIRTDGKVKIDNSIDRNGDYLSDWTDLRDLPFETLMDLFDYIYENFNGRGFMRFTTEDKLRLALEYIKETSDSEFVYTSDRLFCFNINEELKKLNEPV